ncbi:MAG TPA: hypothetical protein VFG55_03550, partial [Rhodanobacteraceae bacterium]|nr:hypothetical protein [Rhodanobacteraceae bacterium]
RADIARTTRLDLKTRWIVVPTGPCTARHDALSRFFCFALYTMRHDASRDMTLCFSHPKFICNLLFLLNKLEKQGTCADGVRPYPVAAIILSKALPTDLSTP